MDAYNKKEEGEAKKAFKESDVDPVQDVIDAWKNAETEEGKIAGLK